VLLPDLFYRAGAYVAPDPKLLFSDEATRKAHFTKFFSTTSVDTVMRDTTAFLAYLDAQPDARAARIATTGYCMGGRMSLSAAAHFGERIAAAAAFHPGNIQSDLAAGNIRAKVYVAGASEDPTFTDEQKHKLDEALTAAGVDHVIETYPARHGWVPSDTPVHDDACAERHWKALFELLAKTIG